MSGDIFGPEDGGGAFFTPEPAAERGAVAAAVERLRGQLAKVGPDHAGTTRMFWLGGWPDPDDVYLLVRALSAPTLPGEDIDARAAGARATYWDALNRIGDGGTELPAWAAVVRAVDATRPLPGPAWDGLLRAARVALAVLPEHYDARRRLSRAVAQVDRQRDAVDATRPLATAGEARAEVADLTRRLEATRDRVERESREAWQTERRLKAEVERLRATPAQAHCGAWREGMAEPCKGTTAREAICDTCGARRAWSATPAPLTEEEAQTWAHWLKRRLVAASTDDAEHVVMWRALFRASRGDIPTEVRPMKNGEDR